MPRFRYAAFATFPDRASAQLALVDLADFGLAQVQVKLFECRGHSSIPGILHALMSNGTWAESDARRGLAIGIGVGSTLGALLGGVVFGQLELPSGFGFGFGAFAGILIGAVMSGIVGAGLVNPRLARTVLALQGGQVLVSISSRSAAEHERAIRLLRTGSLDVETDRPRR